ncbi:hypothetical protein AVP3_0018 [Aeromonas phage AVP3]|nr:hypothetical protein [Aeromonas phage BUCT552]
MPLRKTTGTLYLFREGKKISLKPGELVDLSSDELKQIKAINPDALEHPSEADIELHELRTASRSAVVAKDADGPATPAKKPAAKKKPAATAGAADAETAAAATAAAAAAATEGGDTNKAAEDDEDEDL